MAISSGFLKWKNFRLMKTFTKVAFCVLAVTLLAIAAFPDRSKRVENAVEEGKLLLREVRETKQLPTQFDTSNFRKGARYVRVPEDEKTFYISVPVRFSRDCVIYYEGPLYPKRGWYFRNEKISE